MAKSKLIIGTRGSKLALWQSNYIAGLLKEIFPVEVELKIIKTQGDKILDVPLAKVGGKGLFVKEIEVALAGGEVDLAVHSMKDVPTELPDGLGITAMTKRVDPRDVLISENKIKLLDLPKGTTIGTSSLRRQAQLLHLRPDFRLVDVRGNLETRLRKMDEGRFGAMILAAAGIDRMGYSDQITERISPELSLPAVGQGAIGIETRLDDREVNTMVAAITDDATVAAVTAERALLKLLQGGCQVPIGALGTIEGDTLTLQGVVAALDGLRIFRDQNAGPIAEAESIGIELAKRLLAAGAGEVLAEIRADSEVIYEAESHMSGDSYH